MKNLVRFILMGVSAFALINCGSNNSNNNPYGYGAYGYGSGGYYMSNGYCYSSTGQVIATGSCPTTGYGSTTGYGGLTPQVCFGNYYAPPSYYTITCNGAGGGCSGRTLYTQSGYPVYCE